MPVADEKNWVHVRLRKELADELRVIANREHRYGVQVETNLAVETYIRKCRGLLVYAIYKGSKCIYVGATSNLYDRVTAHRKKFGKECRIEILEGSSSFKKIREIELKYIQHFKAIGQAEFNVADWGTTNPGLNTIPLSTQYPRLDLRSLRKYKYKDDGR
jgi:predicted GIY-YIG superfamily endonuclease